MFCSILDSAVSAWQNLLWKTSTAAGEYRTLFNDTPPKKVIPSHLLPHCDVQSLNNPACTDQKLKESVLSHRINMYPNQLKRLLNNLTKKGAISVNDRPTINALIYQLEKAASSGEFDKILAGMNRFIMQKKSFKTIDFFKILDDLKEMKKINPELFSLKKQEEIKKIIQTIKFNLKSDCQYNILIVYNLLLFLLCSYLNNHFLYKKYNIYLSFVLWDIFQSKQAFITSLAKTTNAYYFLHVILNSSDGDIYSLSKILTDSMFMKFFKLLEISCACIKINEIAQKTIFVCKQLYQLTKLKFA